MINGLASAPPASDCRIGVSISKNFIICHCLIKLIHFALVLNTFLEEDSLLNLNIVVYIFSISVNPCHLSGKGSNDLDNISQFSTLIESSPLLVFLIVP